MLDPNTNFDRDARRLDDCLKRFEAIRGLLWHAALAGEWEAFPDHGDTLAAYAAALRASRARVCREGGGNPIPPDLPTVEMTEQVVGHITCSGRTAFRVVRPQGWGWRLEVRRTADAPLSPTSSRDVALATLIGWTAGGLFGPACPQGCEHLLAVWTPHGGSGDGVPCWHREKLGLALDTLTVTDDVMEVAVMRLIDAGLTDDDIRRSLQAWRARAVDLAAVWDRVAAHRDGGRYGRWAARAWEARHPEPIAV